MERFKAFKLTETPDKKIRGELMDEGVDLLTLLQWGKPF